MKLAGIQTDTPARLWNFEEFANSDLVGQSCADLNTPTFWCIEVPNSEFQLEPCYAFLSPDEKRRRDRFKHKGARLQFLTAHIALHIFLNQFLKKDYRDVTIKETAHHKPFVELPDGSTPLEFNISHCKKWVALIVGPNPVGIDIEGQRDFDSIRGVADIVYTDLEKEIIFSRSDETLTQFYRHWSCKEAYLKACGTGLIQDPRTIEMDFTGDRISDQPIVWWTEQIEGHCLAWSERPD